MVKRSLSVLKLSFEMSRPSIRMLPEDASINRKNDNANAVISMVSGLYRVGQVENKTYSIFHCRFCDTQVNQCLTQPGNLLLTFLQCQLAHQLLR
jgi:hypothetical protein